MRADRPRIGQRQADFKAKTALGAEKALAWEYHKTPFMVVKRLKEGGYEIIGIEQDARARDYRSYRAADKTVFVLGNEVRGLSKQLRDCCDVILEIPMRGAKESLNVSVAAGIILFSALQ